MLTLLGVHVIFQYAVVPNASGLTGNDWAPAETASGPDLALACEQWIGRRSLKMPKGYVEREPEDADDAPAAAAVDDHSRGVGDIRVVALDSHALPPFAPTTTTTSASAAVHATLASDNTWRSAGQWEGQIGRPGDERNAAFPHQHQRGAVPQRFINDDAGPGALPPGGLNHGGTFQGHQQGIGEQGGPVNYLHQTDGENRKSVRLDRNAQGHLVPEVMNMAAQGVTGSFVVPAPSPASTTHLWAHRHHSNQARGVDDLQAPAYRDNEGQATRQMQGTQTPESHGSMSGGQVKLSGQQLLSDRQGNLHHGNGYLHSDQEGLPGNQGGLPGNQGGNQGYLPGNRGLLSGSQGVLSGNQGVLSGNQGVLSNNQWGSQDMLPGNQGFVQNSQGVQHDNQRPILGMEQGLASGKRLLYQNQNLPDSQVNRMPSSQGMLPGDHNHGGLSGSHGGVPGSQGVLPGSHGGLPGSHGGLPGSHGVLPGGHGELPGSHGVLPGSHGELPGSHGELPGSHGVLSGGVAVHPSSHPLPGQLEYRTRDDATNPHHQRYMFTCSNIQLINIKRKLGQGVTKQVYLGVYDNRKVAVKMVTRNVIDVLSCMKKLRRETSDLSTLPGEKHKCYTLPNMKLMKEILLLNQLDHPNLLKLQGYCVRSEETDSTSLQEHGIVAVYEYGLRFYISNLKEWPWQLRVRTATELADLLEYLEHSPLGSLRVSDFKDAHFLLKDGRIKLTDLDDVTSLEPACQPNPGPEVDLKGNRTPAKICGFDLKCVAGMCPGYNAMKNLDNFNRLFFSNLLTGDTPETEEHMSRIRARLDNLSIGAAELRRTLYHFLDVPYMPGYS